MNARQRRTARRRTDPIVVDVCGACWAAYEAWRHSCPECGRRAQRHVDHAARFGLVELSQDEIDRLRQAITPPRVVPKRP